MWIESGFAVKLNGQTLSLESKPGSYAEISRSWKTGDTLEIALPFRLRTEGFRDNPNRLAFLHGPLVLCAEVDTKRPIPAIVTESGGLLAGLQPVSDRPSTFAGSAQLFRLPGESAGANLVLEPLYKVHGERHYVVYWDLFTPVQWQTREAEYAAEQARRKELDSRTVDLVVPGEEQNERDHKFAGEKSATGGFQDRHWRHADDGWFRYVLKVRPDQPQQLSVTYWGSDSGNRVFDILVDGKTIATETLRNNRPDQFYDQVYLLPAELIKGKGQITVTFQAHPRQIAGGIFGLRVLSEWKLVWNDEFDQAGLPDPAKWGYETGFIRNNERQFYTRTRKENARVENGMLIIEGRKERWNDPPAAEQAGGRSRRNRGPAEYTSASLTTRGKAAWTHGRIEVRAKLPSARGTWPAIWTLGTNIGEVGWPACGEIDIMEFVGFEPGVVHANIHTKKYNHVTKTGKGDKILIADASVAFHVYAVEWDSKKMDFSVDGKTYFTYRNEGSGEAAWPYDKPQYLILNLAIGGDWGGQKGIDESSFPQKYLIDYVRVYQKAEAPR